MQIDIRIQKQKVTSIRFATIHGGTQQGGVLVGGFKPQVNIHRSEGDESLCHIKYDDIDNFIAALQEAKRLWE